MLRDDLSRIISAALARLIQAGKLPEALSDIPVEILDTKQPEHGEFACNLALVASKRAGMNPRQLAELLRSAVLVEDEACADESAPAARMVAEGSPPHGDRRTPLIHEIEIAGPGFLNIRLKPEAVAAYVRLVLTLGPDLPKNRPTRRLRINVEFVSVNPNGPITVGSGRGAAYGDTLCRVLEAAGHQVNREYYINDGVNSEQMRLFAESVRHYYHAGLGLDSMFPEKGYRGEYVLDVAREIHERFGEGHDRDLTAWFQSKAQELMLQRQRDDLHGFGVDFDTWFSEQSLHDSGEVARCLDELMAKRAADEEPFRTVLKMGRGGVVEEVAREEQPIDEEDSEHEPSPSIPDPQTSATLWLRSTKFGDDMDRVLRRQDGRLTYIASDVAYHKDKLTDASGQRGTGPVDKLITILGPDHHGYIGRLQAVLAALLERPEAAEVPPSPLSDTDRLIYHSEEERDACAAALEEAKRRLEVVIFQIVRFIKDGEPAPMRKRDGNIYELRDLLSELGAAVAAHATKEEQLRIGRDVARYFYLMRSHDTHMDFDIDLATKQSDENPVFYVQYAHARICGVLRRASEAGIASGASPTSFDPAVLSHSREQALIRKILDTPWEVKRCSEDYGVHRLAAFAVELARTFHHFYDACRVVQIDEPELTGARIALCEAARIALRETLQLLGVSAPERMDREEIPV